MVVNRAVREVLRVAEEFENISDTLCRLKAPDVEIVLERLKLPETCSAVLIPVRLFTGPKHLKLTAYLTEVAWFEGHAIARKKEIEFMLTYLATRQIRDALEKFRSKDGDVVLYVWCVDGGVDTTELSGCSPLPESDQEAELEAIERTALFWAEQHR